MLEWIRDSFHPDDVFYDIGANVGAYSLLAAAVHGPALTVVSFEPSATNYAQLCRNIALNPFARAIRPLPIALTSVPGIVNFHYSDMTAGAALHQIGGDGREARFTQPVLASSLDEIVRVYGLASPNHIKVDVDGGEIGVFEGATKTLRNPSLRTMLIELHEVSPEFVAVDRMVREAGFELAAKHRSVPGAIDPKVAGYHSFIYRRV
jgi:FkbM family methyltransferase